MSKKRKRKTKKSNEINKEIISIITIAIGIFFIVSLRSNSVGFVGDIIKLRFGQLFGLGSNIIPFIILAIGISYSIDKVEINDKKKLISIFIIFVGLITIFDIIEVGYITNFLDRVDLSLENGIYSKGGGLLGTLIAYIVIKLFGNVGSYIVIISAMVVSLLLVTNVSVVKLITVFYKKIINMLKISLISIKEFVYISSEETKKKEKNKDSFKNKTKKNTIKKEKQEEINEKIKILDYTKQDENKDNNTSKIKKDKDIENKREEPKEVKQENFKDIKVSTTENYEEYKFPSLDILSMEKNNNKPNEKKLILKNANKLEDVLNNFGIKAEVKQISKGPTITRYELQPAPGIKVSRIVNLSDDIALGLAASDIRIEAPIPGKAAIGIEVPNTNKINVRLREVLETKEYKKLDSKLAFALGKDIAGKPIIENIEKMPHLLIAGATGSGKSVCVNTLIASILYKARPDEVKLLMIDPKVVELSIYNGIPHLLIPVVTDPKKASGALNWAVQEMTKRYNLFAKTGVRDFTGYNKKIENDKENDKLPQLVIIIDELADLMMVSPSEVEDSICRLAQMARAAGIHLIVATQRPSVDVITGTIKANIPSRLSFAVSSQADSRTILDMGGAEKLLGKGDMLFYPVEASKPKRIQGAFIDEKEVDKIVEFLKEQKSANYKEEIINDIESDVNTNTDDCDELLADAINLVVEEGQASISYLQRKLRIGYARAARLVDDMEERGIVGGYEGSKPRKVLISKEELEAN
ncbi:MAG: DNA translocase FtsK [Firmicutes bacterium]|nr:DNA translocase FtsK [Bacillota bacterium]